jgi:hypothetical protein
MLWLTFSLREERELERKFSFTFIVVGFLLLFYPGSQSTICEIGTRAEGTLLKWLLRKCMCLNHLLLFPPSIFLLLLNFSSPREEWSMKQVNDANVDVGRKEKNKTGTNNSQDGVIAVCLRGSCLVSLILLLLLLFSSFELLGESGARNRHLSRW